MNDDTLYTVLGISETATQDEIMQAYRDCVEAYEVLSDSTQRLAYDRQLAESRFVVSISPSNPRPQPQAAETGLMAIVKRLPKPNWEFLTASILLGALWYIFIFLPR
jgi:curved DNA-binding protein CbpA